MVIIHLAVLSGINHVAYDRESRPTVWARKRSQWVGLFLYPTNGKRREFTMKGRIHSVESMGLVDGPGIRTVVFLQGCGLRCQYCHNPDTWECGAASAKEMTPEELVAKLRRFKSYYGATGGVTFSGGEPLLQPEFLAQALELCQKEGIHTCLDTAGCGLGDYQRILSHTDLVLLDIKHYTPQGFQAVTGRDTGEWRAFLSQLQAQEVPLWIRHVVVPGLTDGDEHLQGLLDFVSTLRHVRRVELLPYHTLGVHKYHTLGYPYPLEGVEPLAKDALAGWQEKFDRAFPHI